MSEAAGAGAVDLRTESHRSGHNDRAVVLDLDDAFVLTEFEGRRVIDPEHASSVTGDSLQPAGP